MLVAGTWYFSLPSYLTFVFFFSSVWLSRFGAYLDSGQRQFSEWFNSIQFIVVWILFLTNRKWTFWCTISSSSLFVDFRMESTRRLILVDTFLFFPHAQMNTYEVGCSAAFPVAGLKYYTKRTSLTYSFLPWSEFQLWRSKWSSDEVISSYSSFVAVDMITWQ